MSFHSELEPRLREGLASRRKKLTAKSEVVEVDKKALKNAVFIEQIEMFGSLWNKFEDNRGWIWTQENEEDKGDALTSNSE